MGNYLKQFESHSQYENFIESSDFVTPNVSYCEGVLGVELHYNSDSQTDNNALIASYYVNDASQQTYIYGYYVDGDYRILGANMFSNIKIDGVDVSPSSVDANKGMYQLSVGEHTIEFTLIDPTTIPNESFYDCPITAMSIPDSVTTIGGYAFADCGSLINATFPSGLLTIENNAFKNCCSLDDASKNFIQAINASAWSCSSSGGGGENPGGSVFA